MICYNFSEFTAKLFVYAKDTTTKASKGIVAMKNVVVENVSGYSHNVIDF